MKSALCAVEIMSVAINQSHVLSPSENSPWFVGKMERGQAEQFLMDVSQCNLV